MGSVIEQQYNGVPIKAKAKIQWGSRVTLVIGAGLGNEQVPVPSLVGMTYAEAKAYLDENNISLGAVVLDGR